MRHLNGIARSWIISGVSVVLFIGIAFFALPAGSALAAPGSALAAPGGCPATYMCIFVDPGYAGERGDFAGDNANLGDFSSETCGTWADCDASVYNNGTSGDGVRLYRLTNYDGGSVCISDHSGYSNLRDVDFPDGEPVAFNAESDKWVSSC
jgi:hypothetical protein